MPAQINTVRVIGGEPSRRAPIGMHAPDRWLAFLRVVVGLWFLKSLFTKLTIAWVAGVVPVPVATERWTGFMPRRVAEWAASNPLGWYAGFLNDVVVPRTETFALLTALGESAVGVALTFGVLTGWGALGGLFLILNYFLASLGAPFNQQGFHILLLACLLAFLLARSGRRWGIDGWLARRHPTRFGRLPLV